MAESIQLEIVTPTGAVVSEAVDIVTAPGVGGEFGVLANHAPFLSTLKIGTLTYKQGGTTTALMISGGFCEVSKNKITFLAEAAEKGADIDVDRAMKAKERAEKRLLEAKSQKEKIDMARVEASLQRSIARIKTAENK